MPNVVGNKIDLNVEGEKFLVRVNTQNLHKEFWNKNTLNSGPK